MIAFLTEFPQTQQNLTLASENLFQLIQQRNIVLYPDAGMRLAASRAIATEMPRGWRFDKAKQSHKRRCDRRAEYGMSRRH